MSSDINVQPKQGGIFRPQNKRWQLPVETPASQQKYCPNLNRLIVQILYNRGIATPQAIENFLNRTYQPCNPLQMKGVAQAIRNIERAIKANDKIAVYGDFDVDGVTATVLIVKVLRALGANVNYHIPNRIQGEHGLNTQALRKLWRDGVRLVITADCGIRDVNEVKQARTGLDIIITDHHSVGAELPPALAIINPKQTDCPYPFKELAGVGVAFKLAQALLQHSDLARNEPPLTEDDLLELVALGTVSDLVPLREENRALVYRGLERIKHTQHPGIESLCRSANVRPERVDATIVSYILAPRLNAAGRMAHAEDAYQLLETTYPAEANHLAEKLSQLNQERQRQTSDLQNRAHEIVQSGFLNSPLIFIAGQEFAAGLAGLVAGRLAEEFYRPAVVVEKGKKTSKGSARSIPEFHITNALDKCSDLLARHGGHALAAGFTVLNENLDELAIRLQAMAAEQLANIELRPVLVIDAVTTLSEMAGLQEEMSKMEPFGYDNPCPLFLSRNVFVKNQRAVGDGKHLKLTLSDGQLTWDGIAFRQGEWAGKLPGRLDIVYHLEVNEWNGERRLQLNVQDLRPAGLEDTVAHLWLDQSEPKSGEA